MFRNRISRSQTCLYSIFYQKRYRIYTTISRYRGHSAIVWHSTNFATVHSRVTEGGCLMEYKYKLLCQFSTAVGGTRWYLWLKQSHSNSLQGHTKHFYSYVGIEQNGSGWKAPGYSKNGYLVTLKKTMANWETFYQNTPKTWVRLGMIYAR